MNSSPIGHVPYSVESEEALLGSVIINPDILSDLDWLNPADFYLIKNGWVFESMQALHTRGEAVDYVTLCEELEAVNRLETVGGRAYITYLINQTPTHIHYYTYARIVESASRRRKVLNLAGDLAQGALKDDRETIRALVAQAQSLLESPAIPDDDIRKYLVHESELKNLPPIKWHIPGEIPDRGLILLYGPSGIGKSFVALNVALRLGQKMPILYIAAEGEYGYPARVEAWYAHHKLPRGNTTFLMNVVSLLEPLELKKFIEAIRPLAPRIIVVDTMAHCMLPGDENSTRDMGMFVRASKAVARELDCAVVLVHHTSKAGEVERGNSALRAACDVMIRLSDDDDVIRVECSKTKDAKPFSSYSLKLLPVQLPDGTLTPVVIGADRVTASKDDPLTTLQQKVLNSLSLEVYRDGATPTEIAENTRIPRGQVVNILSKLLRVGHILQPAPREPYVITNQGVEALVKCQLVNTVSNSDSTTPARLQSLTPTFSAYRAKTPTEPPNSEFSEQDDPRFTPMPESWLHQTDSLESEPRVRQNDLESWLHQTDSLESPNPVSPLDTEQNNNITTQPELLSYGRSATPPVPDHACPNCGSANWTLSKVTGSWYCWPCSEETVRQLMNARSPDETQTNVD